MSLLTNLNIADIHGFRHHNPQRETGLFSSPAELAALASELYDFKPAKGAFVVTRSFMDAEHIKLAMKERMEARAVIASMDAGIKMKLLGVDDITITPAEYLKAWDLVFLDEKGEIKAPVAMVVDGERRWNAIILAIAAKVHVHSEEPVHEIPCEIRTYSTMLEFLHDSAQANFLRTKGAKRVDDTGTLALAIQMRKEGASKAAFQAATGMSVQKGQEFYGMARLCVLYPQLFDEFKKGELKNWRAKDLTVGLAEELETKLDESLTLRLAQKDADALTLETQVAESYSEVLESLKKAEGNKEKAADAKKTAAVIKACKVNVGKLYLQAQQMNKLESVEWLNDYATDFNNLLADCIAKRNAASVTTPTAPVEIVKPSKAAKK